jgi:hypothetical protein
LSPLAACTSSRPLASVSLMREKPGRPGHDGYSAAPFGNAAMELAIGTRSYYSSFTIKRAGKW